MRLPDNLADCNAALVLALEALRQLESAHRQAERQLAALYQRRAELTAKPTEQPKGPQQ